MFNILVAEDDKYLQNLIKKHLERCNFNVTLCDNGEKALEALQSQDINLVLSDIMMPAMDGNTLIKHIRQFYPTLPVIVLTALYGINDKRTSFESGADDYIVKPIDFDELELRIRAVLRRYNQVSAKTITVGNTKLDYATKQLIVNGKDIPLRKTEFSLLYIAQQQRADIQPFAVIGRVGR